MAAAIFCSVPGVRLYAILALLPSTVAADIFVGTNGGIRAFHNFDDGNIAPHAQWSGALTGLIGVAGVAIDLVHREVWATSAQVPEVSVFSLDQPGNFAPLRKIAGAATGLISPFGILLDFQRDEVYVLDRDAEAIFIFPRGRNGDGAPVRGIQGAATTLDLPVFGFLDLVHDEIFVANIAADNAHVAVFSRPTGTGIQNMPPLRQLTVDGIPSGLHVDLPADGLVVADLHGDRVLFYPRTAQTGDVPVRQILGGQTGLHYPAQIVLNRFDELVVGNGGTMFDPPSIVTHVASASGDAPPARTIEGVQALLEGTIALASDFARDCSWAFSVDGCIHRDNFESGELCYWSAVQGGASCP